MKKRSVMRLLAIAIAASVTVTSPAVPASLTTVWADELNSGATITVSYGDVTDGAFTDSATYNDTSVTIKASYSGTTYKISDQESSDLSAAQTSFDISGSDGETVTKTLYFQDQSNGSETVFTKTITVKFDTTAPTIDAASYEDASDASNAKANINVTASEGGTIYYIVSTDDATKTTGDVGTSNSETLVNKQCVIATGNLTASTKEYVYLYAVDAAGNKSGVTKVSIPGLQTTPTAATLSFAVDEEDYSRTAKLTINGDDGLLYSTDNTTFGAKSTIATTGYAAGETVTVYVKKDAAGDAIASKSVASAEAEAPAASTKPTITEKTNSDGTKTVTITATNAGTVYYTVDGSTPLASAGATSGTASFDATEAEAADKSGTRSAAVSAEGTVEVKVAVPSTVRAITLESGKIVSDIASISFSKSGASTQTTVSNTTGSTDNTGAETPAETETTNSAGKQVTTTTTQTTDSTGAVTGVTETSEIVDVAKDTTATLTVQKDTAGKVTDATAAVTKTATGTSAKLTGSVVKQLVEAAGTEDVQITFTVTDTDGKTKYTVKADADELIPGSELSVYQLKKNGEYVMVNAKTYTVNSNGGVSVSFDSNKTYELVTATEKEAIQKQIKATVKVKKSSATVKKGKTTTIALASGVNKKNIKKITYTTGKKSVATVDKNGKITAKKKGTVTIKAKVTFVDGSTKTIKETVKVK